jgi:hypothetical protein
MGRVIYAKVTVFSICLSVSESHLTGAIKPFSFDNPVEIGLVVKHMINDEFWQLNK